MLRNEHKLRAVSGYLLQGYVSTWKWQKATSQSTPWSLRFETVRYTLAARVQSPGALHAVQCCYITQNVPHHHTAVPAMEDAGTRVPSDAA